SDSNGRPGRGYANIGEGLPAQWGGLANALVARERVRAAEEFREGHASRDACSGTRKGSCGSGVDASGPNFGRGGETRRGQEGVRVGGPKFPERSRGARGK